MVSFRDVADAYLTRIREYDGEVGAFLSVQADTVLKQAEDLDRKYHRGDLRLESLTGIPIAVKDVISTEGIRTTCASRILENYVPPYDATAVQRLKEQNALILGKTNCDEFAMGSSTETSGFFTTRNPLDLERVPGGSSGGSAACVAAWEAPASLGTDTGGSIRQPAAFCGVVGLKPTYGRVSRYGLVAFASSLDVIGPFANTVRDVAIVLKAIAGKDRRDSTSSHQPVEDYLLETDKGVKGMRVGIPSEWLGSGLDDAIKESIQLITKRLQKMDCSLQEVHLPHTKYAIATYYLIATAEASSNLARYDGVKYGYRTPRPADLEEMYRKTRSEGFGDEVKRRIMLGTYALSSGYYDAFYLKAGKVRTLVTQDYLKVFEEVDLLVGPTTPILPFKLGEKISDPLEMYLTDVYTVTANLAGIPGLSLPIAFTSAGLPVGLQILGPHFQEAKLLRLGHAIEQDLGLERPRLAFEKAV
ncbi:MAG: Asp-tRNA(Asn)/Glu-tRNA(Gln) amidotransferase subunit GatA [Acidobacteria bacterium]|nr:Asp-tRNA(Asn)/Glu-tRNA(Gln) amidotransferase subunit GatA [Acidobacteriota bacterium]